MKVEKWTYPEGATLAHIQTTPGRRAVVLLSAAFQPGTSLNVIVYYHGNWVTARSGVTSWKELLAHFTLANLIKAVRGCGKPLAMIIPDIGEFSAKKAGEKDELDGQIADTLLVAAYRANELRAGKTLPDPSKDYQNGNEIKALSLGSLVIAGHSGAGKTIFEAINSGSGNLTNLKEIWMFDSLYKTAGSADDWINFATKTTVDIHIFYNDTKAKALDIKAKAKDNPAVYNIRTIEFTPDHDKAPGAHVGKLIKDSKAL